MTDNKTLLKQFANIYASCNKAKQSAITELAKIDEKYRKLAEKEKEQLNELVKTIESQMELYGNYLGLNKTDEKTEYVEPDPVEEAPEMTIQDTIFPENNEENEGENTTESAPMVESTTEPDAVSDDSVSASNEVDTDWAVSEPEEKQGEIASSNTSDEEVAMPEEWSEPDEKPEKKKVPVLVDGEDGWPEFPEDWK